MTASIPAAVPSPASPALDRVPARTQDGPQAAGQFGILFVCTGNLCRSVIAERLARRGLHARLGADACRFRVASAGIAALDGCLVHPYTAEALGRLGADADGVVSHALTADDVEAADLILTAGREHRDAVMAMRPGASRRAYLLREFARLAAVAPLGAPGRHAADISAAGGPASRAPGAERLGTEQGTERLGTAEPAAGHFAAGVTAAGCSAVDQARHLVAEAAQLRGLVPYVEAAEDEIADPVSTSAAFLDCARTIDAAVSQALDAICRGLPGGHYRGKHAR